ncbi:SAM-dependent methyltransferase [Cuniculiplasma divulgatum]|nr:SAM-dependent methyltransferase [Cuniculiplasma divulgatum]
MMIKGKETAIFLRTGQNLYDVKDPYGLINLLSLEWEILEFDNTFVVLKNLSGVKLKCRLREGFDFGHIFEIFEKNTYPQNFKNSMVIDIGASTADSCIYFAINGANEVYGLEPMKESYELAVYNVMVNNLTSKVHIINAACSSKSGSVYLNVSSKNPNANSINQSKTVKGIGINFDSRILVDSISLKDIIYQYNLTKVDLLKMDCEGCEYEVFQNIEESDISIINNIILEFHDGIKFLPDLLKRHGFDVRYDHSKEVGILTAYRK